MEISFDKTHKTQGVIKISVNKVDFQPGVNQKIMEYSKTANIKGFRPGKVPPAMIRKMYGQALIVEEINKLVSNKLNGYLKDSDTQFLGEPLPVQKDETYDWENAEDFDFEYNIGFAEDFSLKVDKGVTLDRSRIKVDDQVINETIINLRRKFGEVENPEVVSEEDTLYGNLTSKDGDITHEISIDLRDAEKAFAKKANGAKIGDELDVDPKKSFKHEGVIKNQIQVDENAFRKLKKLKFEIKSINHYKLVPIDQDLFDKALGKEAVRDESDFRDRLKEIVAKNYEREEEQFFNHQVKEKLIENARISIPEEFLKEWLIKTNENMTKELVELEFASYAKELKWSLIRNLLIKEQELKVEHEDVINEAKELIKKQFAGSGMGDQFNDQLDTFANNYLQGENGENYMKVFNQVQNNKVLEYIKEQISIRNKEVTLDEFRKL